MDGKTDERIWPVKFSQKMVKVFILTNLVVLLVPWEFWLESNISLNMINCGVDLSAPLGCDHLGRNLIVVLHQTFVATVIPSFLISCTASAGAAAVAVMMCKSELWRCSLFWSTMAGCLSIPLIVIVAAAMNLVGFHSAADLYCLFLLVFLIKGLVRFRQLYYRDKKTAYWEQNKLFGGTARERFLKYGLLTGWNRDLIEFTSCNFTLALIIESSLSYFGFGLTDPELSLGSLLAENYEQLLGASGVSSLFVIAAFLTCVNAHHIIDKKVP